MEGNEVANAKREDLLVMQTVEAGEKRIDGEPGFRALWVGPCVVAIPLGQFRVCEACPGVTDCSCGPFTSAGVQR